MGDELEWRKLRDRERETEMQELKEQRAALEKERVALQKAADNLAAMNKQIEEDSDIARERIAGEERAARKWRHRAAEISASMDQWNQDRF